MSLHDFITSNRNELIHRTRAKVAQRAWPSVSHSELEQGVPLFLTQLAETLRRETHAHPFPSDAIGASAAKHGADLLRIGYNLSQVVHDYGDVCQSITELAIERKATITPEEFHTLNRSLDTAMAEAVMEYGRLQEEASSQEELELRGRVGHELRNKMQTIVMAFGALKSGAVAIGGSTGGLLGRSIVELRDLIDRSLAEVRLDAGKDRRVRVSLSGFVDELAVAARLHAEYRDIQFTIESVDPALGIVVDPQLLASAVMNLLQNAFKYSRAHGRVTLGNRAEHSRIMIDVEDECGGLAVGGTELFRPFGDRRGKDRSGLGLGLSISRRAVRASGGDIRAHDVPGKGCIFTIDLPAAP